MDIILSIFISKIKWKIMHTERFTERENSIIVDIDICIILLTSSYRMIICSYDISKHNNNQAVY